MSAEIRDLSAGGAKIFCSGVLAVGEEVELRGARLYQGAELQTLRCIVRWTHEDHQGSLAGLQFSDTQADVARSWLFAELTEQNKRLMLEQQRRRMVRVWCSIPARLLSREHSLHANIVNLSPDGALVKANGQLMDEGEKVGLVFGPFESMAKIVVRGTIANVHTGSTPAYGIKFQGFNTGDPEELKYYLDFFKRELEPT